MIGRILRWSALAVSVVGPFVAIPSSTLTGSDRLWPLSWLAWGPVGFLILRKRPGSGVGSSLLFIGGTMGLSFLTLGLSEYLAVDEPSVWLEMVSLVAGVLPWLGIIWLVLVFPSGDFDGIAERVVGRLLLVFGTLAVLAFAFDATPMESTRAPSPLAIPAITPLTRFITAEGGFLLIPALLLVAVGLMIRRWLRSTGLERAQFRWLFLGASFFLAALIIGQIVPEDSTTLMVWLPAGFAIPVSIGVAITRYRLYEIDRIVSRTLAYALVIVLLGVVFALGVVMVPNLVVGTGSAPPPVVAASTLAVAALFNPLRHRVLDWVDRRFNRSRYDAQVVMDQFASSLRDTTDADEVVGGLLGAVSRTMQPSSVGVWVRR